MGDDETAAVLRPSEPPGPDALLSGQDRRQRLDLALGNVETRHPDLDGTGGRDRDRRGRADVAYGVVLPVDLEDADQVPDLRRRLWRPQFWDRACGKR